MNKRGIHIDPGNNPTYLWTNQSLLKNEWKFHCQQFEISLIYLTYTWRGETKRQGSSLLCLCIQSREKSNQILIIQFLKKKKEKSILFLKKISKNPKLETLKQKIKSNSFFFFLLEVAFFLKNPRENKIICLSVIIRVILTKEIPDK